MAFFKRQFNPAVGCGNDDISFINDIAELELVHATVCRAHCGLTLKCDDFTDDIC